MKTAWTGIEPGFLVGTNRLPWKPVPASELSGIVLARDDSSVAAALQTLSILSAGQRAACVGLACVDPPRTAPLATGKLLSLAAERLLRRLMTIDSRLVGIFLERTSSSGFTLPHPSLAEILDFAKNRQPLHAPLCRVLGARGHWLAQQNLEWNKMILAPVEAALDAEAAGSIWQTGSESQRIALLDVLRGRDSDLARSFVEQTWNDDAIEFRLKVVRNFVKGLTSRDEAFLESVLDDRRKEIRIAARDLLMHLPESSFRERQLARLSEYVQVQREKGRLVLSVEPPKNCDKAMERDGIQKKVPAGMKIGEKAWWLRQVLALVPPSLVAERLKIAPAELLGCTDDATWGVDLADGFHQACRSGLDSGFSDALVKCDGERYADLLPKMSPNERIALVTANLRVIQGAKVRIAIEQALSSAATVPIELAQAILDVLRKLTVAKYDANTAPWPATWEQIAYALPEACLGEALNDWPRQGEHWDTWQAAFDRFSAPTLLRLEILQTVT
jgi:hypothetical protein